MKWLWCCFWFGMSFAGDRIYLAQYAFDVADGPPSTAAVWDSTPPDTVPYRTFLIHLNRPMSPEVRRTLLNQGVEPLVYMPTNAFLVRARDIKALERVPVIDWVGHWQPAFKVDATLEARLAGTFAEPDVILDLCLLPGADFESLQRRALALGGEVLDVLAVGLVPYMKLRFSGGIDLRALVSWEDVRWVSLPGQRALRNERARWLVQSYDGSSPASQATPLYDRGLHGEGEVVGLIDGTPLLSHCAFEDGEGDPVGPDHRTFVYMSTASVSSHGTHVAATLAGRDLSGDLTHAGVAYGARMAFTRLPGNQSGNLFSIFQTHAGFGAAIHSNSWGETRGNPNAQTYSLDCAHVDQFSYMDENSLVLFATINSVNWPLSTLLSPENALNALTIGATEGGDVANPELLAERHGSSAMGPVPLDQRLKPELFAPGCSLISADSATSCGVRSSCGTSMATPVVAGGAALVRQYFREGWYPKGRRDAAFAETPSGSLLKAILLVGSQNMLEDGELAPNSFVDVPIPNNIEGWGRVNLERSLYFTGDRERFMRRDVRHSDGLETGEAGNLTLENLDGGTELRICLVFMQPPGSPGTLNPVSNDLDLVVTSPSGVVYLGNVFDNGQSVSGGAGDPKNNVEQVRLATPELGVYTVSVVGTAVNVGPQGYALAMTGEILSGVCGEVELDAGDDVVLGCWGDSVTLGEGLPLSLEGQVSWSPTNGLSDASSRTPLATPTETTTYRVSATLPSGCVREAEVRIVVPAMNVDADSDLDSRDLLQWITVAPWYEPVSEHSLDYDGDNRMTILDMLTLRACY